MNGTRITIGVTTAFLLIVLRVAIGWHFFYEGLWKSQHQAQFAMEAEGFLSAARGPLAQHYNDLVPDIDGRDRLVANLALGGDALSGVAKSQSCPLVRSWDAMRQSFVDFYRPASGSKNEDLFKKLQEESQKVFDRHVKGLDAFLKDQGPQIKAHFDSLKRFEVREPTDPKTSFQKQRRWDEMQDLRKEAKAWIVDLDARESAYKKELLDLVAKPNSDLAALSESSAAKKVAADKATKGAAGKDEVATAMPDFSPLAEGKSKAAAGGPFGPVVWNRLQWMSYGLMWTLLAVGACLMLGLFTRPAALVGAGFLLFVVLAQPSFPGVYPTDPPQLGHSLFIGKDSIELIALLVLASSRVGLWAGLDYFIDYIFIRPFRSESDE